LCEIEAALAEKRQMLAFEPPRFSGARVASAGATVGGCVAAGLAGPRRQQAGAVRDFVLGVKLIDGSGQVLDFGGQVMKNVAGYDVSRLVAGSLGTLGLIARSPSRCCRSRSPSRRWFLPWMKPGRLANSINGVGSRYQFPPRSGMTASSGCASPGPRRR
jgi:hypothetical protein